MPKVPNWKGKILIGVAVGAGVVGAGVVGSPTAGADPSAFSVLSCSCQQPAPADSAVRKDAIARGIRQGLSDSPSGARHQLSSENFRP
jgi:hypothetical protein